jgi:hypothetical protein
MALRARLCALLLSAGCGNLSFVRIENLEAVLVDDPACASGGKRIQFHLQLRNVSQTFTAEFPDPPHTYLQISLDPRDGTLERIPAYDSVPDRLLPGATQEFAGSLAWCDYCLGKDPACADGDLAPRPVPGRQLSIWWGGPHWTATGRTQLIEPGP